MHSASSPEWWGKTSGADVPNQGTGSEGSEPLSAGDLDKTPLSKGAVFIKMAGAVWQEKFLSIPVLEELLVKQQFY